MKIIFMGTPDFAVHTLRALYEAGHEIVLVVTQPDKPKGRGGRVQMSDVKQYALSCGLEVFQPVRLKDEDSIRRLKETACDLMVVAAFGQILPKEVLMMPPHGCINVHASLLPRLRGASPIQTSILEGDKETGVTIQQMGEGLDTGDILMQRSIPISDQDTGGSLFDRLAQEGALLVAECVEAISRGEIHPVPQDESLATYAKKIDKSMGHIDWNKSAKETELLIRALDPWPSAFSYLNGRMVKIWKAETGEDCKAAPGSVVEVSKDSVTVACGSGSLIIKEMQLEGKKRMPVHDLLLGFSIDKGVSFS
ncbi:MAG: methionyl-tRNA formyltransferase [Lachnospiraceae bacterium]|nr:methionyl-tRNA formyltransferase [Lachnospiraceae bacterium]